MCKKRLVTIDNIYDFSLVKDQIISSDTVLTFDNNVKHLCKSAHIATVDLKKILGVVDNSGQDYLDITNLTSSFKTA